MLTVRTILILTFQMAIGLAIGQDMKVDLDAVKNLITEWNNAHNIGNVKKLSSLYSDRVIYFGADLARENCLSKKRAMVEKAEFSQTINPDLALTAYSSGAIRCDFVRTVSVKGKSVAYPSYLIMVETRGEYVIVSESDYATDKRIDYEPDLGTKVTIKKGKLEKPRESTIKDDLEFSTLFLTVGGLVIGSIGLLIAFRSRKNKTGKSFSTNTKKTKVAITRTLSNKQLPVVTDDTLPVDKYYAMGLEFEKFIVAKFSKNKNFTLIEWRGDKFHLGIFPESNRHPDLEYKYQEGNVDRYFSIECKYRSRAFAGTIILMNETKYEIYADFHRNKMPVYILLGVGGGPEWPEELYLIPFDHLKTQMTYGELTKFLKRENFAYDLKRDRLI